MCGGWDVNCSEKGRGSLRATKSCVFAVCMVLEIKFLELDAFELRQNARGSPVTLTTPPTDYVEPKEPRAAQKELTGSL